MKKSICLLFLIVNVLLFTVACMASPDSAAPRPNYDENFQSPSNQDSSIGQFNPSPYVAFRFEWNEEYNGYFVYENDNNVYTNLVIPEAYNGKPVVGIGKYAFNSYSKVENVVIPNSIKVIESRAFNYCDYLQNVVYDGNSGLIEIKEYAFYNCKTISRIFVSESVEVIGNFAFSTCPSLKSINVDVNNKNYCSVEGNLYSKDMSILISVAPAFNNTEFVVPNKVIEISDGALCDCDSIISVTIPITVERIGRNVFGKYLKEINYEGMCAEWRALNGMAPDDSAPSEPGTENETQKPGVGAPSEDVDKGYIVNCTDGTIIMTH